MLWLLLATAADAGPWTRDLGSAYAKVGADVFQAGAYQVPGIADQATNGFIGRQYSAYVEQLGFSLAIDFSEDADPATVEKLLETFQYEALVPVSLECGGSTATSGARFEGFVTRWKGSTDEEDRRRLRSWLEARPEVARVEVGELTDAWHGV